jgi:hypothetical protein
MDVLEFLLANRRWDPTCLRVNIARPGLVKVCKTVKRVSLESNTLRGGVDALVRKAIEAIAPEWWGDETKIIVNRNVTCERHVDKNDGHSWILWLGDFTGGELRFDDGRCIYEKRVWHKIDGHVPHWNEPHDGTKYGVVIFRQSAVSKRSLIQQRAKRRAAIQAIPGAIGAIVHKS